MGKIISPKAIGRKGGQARLERKSLAARQNIRLRWHGRSASGAIPVAALLDGTWYRGVGRAASVALWDAHTGTFHTVGMNTYRDPGTYPAIRDRLTRIKQERHIDDTAGSFSPWEAVAAE